jgi:ribosome recycling factor
MDELFKESERKMIASIDHFLAELGKLRTGQASLNLLDGLNIDYYGNPTPISQVATLAVPDSKTITIQPWETANLPAIEKVIQGSELGLNPSNDGKLIRLIIPPLTTERRQQLVKVVKKNTEECKVAIRNVRRDFNDKTNSMEKNGDISKDENHTAHDKIQKLTDKHIQETDKISSTKEKDMMEV